MPRDFFLTPVVETTCPSCPLHDNDRIRHKVTTEVRGTDIEVMFIGEAPGRQENQENRPVVGMSGKILRRVVAQLHPEGLDAGVAYGNLVRCRPVQITQEYMTDRDRTPTEAEIACCRNNILNDIQKLKPKMLVLCGKTAVTGLALNPTTREPIPGDATITSLRGTQLLVVTPDGTEYPAIATYHFAYVARNPVAGSVFQEDISRAFLYARGWLTSELSRTGKPVKLLSTVDQVRSFLRHLVKDLSQHDLVAMDYETTTNTRLNNRLLTVGFAYEPDQAYVIPYRHPQSPWSNQAFNEVKQLLRKFFLTRNVSFGSLVCHNLKFEAAITLDEFGVYLNSFPLEDTMLRTHALNENRKMAAPSRAFGLKGLADEWLNFSGYREPVIAKVISLVTSGKSVEANLHDLAEYNGMDCYVTLRLYGVQDHLADLDGYRAKLKRLGVCMHGPVSVFAAQLERNGIRADVERLKFMMTSDSPILKRQRELESQFYSLATVKEANRILLGNNKRVMGMQSVWGASRASDPWVFHINKQTSKEALYLQVLKLEAKETAHGKPAIDKEFYKKHKGTKEVDIQAEWTELDKLRGTYIDGIYRLINQHPDMHDGRVRAQFSFHDTATSRTASNTPNMQNIPKGKTPSAKAIKSLYIVDPGHLLVCADYSQAEVRWLAEVARDVNLLKAFKAVDHFQQEYARNPTQENAVLVLTRGDFHRQTASQIFNKPPEAVEDAERNYAKSIVFGLVYGMSAYGLATRLGISRQKAEEYQTMFLNQFPNARDWLEWIEREGFRHGFVESPIGRRRHLVSRYTLGNDSPYFEGSGGDGRRVTEVGSYKSYEDRVCRNAPIQSIASDSNLMACIRIQNYILEHKLPWRLVNIVHDSIMAEIPFPDVEEYIQVADRIMSDPEIFSDFDVRPKVPFRADFTVGQDWGHQFKLDPREQCELICFDCGAKREVTRPVQNRRCEECGSQRVEVALLTGPLRTVLAYLDVQHHYSEFWNVNG